MTSRNSRAIALSLVLIISLVSPLLSQPVSAAQLENRSVQVSSAIPSAVVTNDFSFTYITGGNVGSLVFEYCDNSPIFTVACHAPAGLDVSSATITSQTGVDDYGIDNIHTTANKLVLTRVPITAIPPIASTYDFANITNPSTANETIFVRISDYATADASGAYTDNGAVAFATLNPFSIGAYVPPYLRFCVGLTVAQDCSSIAGDTIELGTLSTARASAGQSQFSTGTNDTAGYVIYALGTTMTSGNNVIPASTVPTASFPGSAQFGINLRANSNPLIGQDPAGTGAGVPTPNYNSPNLFVFNAGDAIASSSLPSEFNKMTVSYLVNISSSQPLGVYSTTLTYVATVNF